MLYRLLSSLKTSVFLLSFMCLIFIIGTIFPQGTNIEDYIKAGGKYLNIVRVFQLLNVFTSPLFIALAGILCINLIVCLYDRLKVFLKIKRKPLNLLNLKNHPNIIVIERTDTEKLLKKMRFRLKAKSTEEPQVKVFEKGLPYWWLSWFYHVGIILSIIGFFLTALFAFEKEIVLYPEKSETISLYSKDTRWNKFMKYTGYNVPEEQESKKYILTLKEFGTEYYQGLKFDYPKDKMERLAIGVGIKKIEPSKKEFSYMPKMWLTRLDIKRPDGKILDAELRVNKPFRTGGFTLYQMGYEQKVRLGIHPVRKSLSNGEILDVIAETPFKVKNIKGEFILSSLKLGTLYKKDGTKEKITPFTTVYYIPEEGPSEREVIGSFRLGETLNARGVAFEFKDYKEASYLSYRKDPGIWFVGSACLFVFLGLFVRSIGAWYRVQCVKEDKTTYILISTRGILADKKRIIKRLRQD